MIELTAKKPLVNLRLLLNRIFGIGTVANVLVGFALFGSIYVLPQYLGEVQGYNAEQIGLVLATRIRLRPGRECPSEVLARCQACYKACGNIGRRMCILRVNGNCSRHRL